MSVISFDNFGKLAATSLTPTERAGRYHLQAEAEKQIVVDVVAKLGLKPEDNVLDVGCGAGLLLVPLSYLARSITGIDHASVIEALHRDFPGLSTTLVPGNFLELAIDKKFSAIVAYSVVHYLSSKDELFAFIDKAAGLLAPGGRLLIGDIPNSDKKRRFLQTQAGASFNKVWQEQLQTVQSKPTPVALSADPNLLMLDDELVLTLLARLRRGGCDAYVLPQPSDLPFGHTREDILVCRPLQ